MKNNILHTENEIFKKIMKKIKKLSLLYLK